MGVSQKGLGPAGISSGLGLVAMAVGKLREAHLHWYLPQGLLWGEQHPPQINVFEYLKS